VLDPEFAAIIEPALKKLALPSCKKIWRCLLKNIRRGVSSVDLHREIKGFLPSSHRPRALDRSVGQLTIELGLFYLELPAQE
jgi:hypothetical protein